jgi:hypothetical protein
MFNKTTMPELLAAIALQKDPAAAIEALKPAIPYNRNAARVALAYTLRPRLFLQQHAGAGG